MPLFAGLWALLLRFGVWALAWLGPTLWSLTMHVARFVGAMAVFAAIERGIMYWMSGGATTYIGSGSGFASLVGTLSGKNFSIAAFKEYLDIANYFLPVNEALAMMVAYGGAWLVVFMMKKWQNAVALRWLGSGKGK